MSRRERQILDALDSVENATVSEIHAGIPNPPSRTAVRTLLTILEKKGLIEHREDGRRYVYAATTPKEELAVSSFKKLLHTFFQGSLERAVATLLDHEETQISQEQLDRLQQIIEKAREEGR